MMPVAADAAALQFFTEAMRANTATMEGIRAESRTDRNLIHDIHTRVVRIEERNNAAATAAASAATAAAASVADLVNRVDVLESEKDQRHGARNLGNWLLDKTPSLTAMIIAIFVAVIATLKVTGKL